MKPGGTEADALLSQIRGYIRLWGDPPEQEGKSVEQTKAFAAELFIEAFKDLDKCLQVGDSLPEAWDPVTRYQLRDRAWGTSSYAYIYPPGSVGPAPCTLRSRGCRWLNPGADLTCCGRCHTIRIRKQGT